MKFDEIMKFLDNGLSVSEIQQIIDKENNTGQSAKNADNNLNGTNNNSDNEGDNSAGAKAEQAPAWAETLNNSISALTKTMQANAIMNSNMSNTAKGVDEQANDILATIINPPQAKG